MSLDPDGDESERRGVAAAASFLLYGQLLVYGIWVAMGVVEEKSSRVVEVLLAAVTPRALIAGKIIGLGLLGLAQFALLGVVGLAIASAAGAIEIDHSEAGLYLCATEGRDAWDSIGRLADLGIVGGPGHFYGVHFPGHVRLSLTATDERIAAAAERLSASVGS